jgi:hypothetical protein
MKTAQRVLPTAAAASALDGFDSESAAASNTSTAQRGPAVRQGTAQGAPDDH